MYVYVHVFLPNVPDWITNRAFGVIFCAGNANTMIKFVKSGS